MRKKVGNSVLGVPLGSCEIAAGDKPLPYGVDLIVVRRVEPCVRLQTTGNLKTRRIFVFCPEFVKRKIDTAELQRLKSEIKQYGWLLVLPGAFVLWQILDTILLLFASEETHYALFSMDFVLINVFLKGAFFGGLVIAVNNCSKNMVCIYLLPYIIFYSCYFIINIQPDGWADMSLAGFNLIGIFNVMLFIIVMKMFVLLKKRKKFIVIIYYYVTAIVLTVIYDFAHIMYLIIFAYETYELPYIFAIAEICGTVIGCTIGCFLVNQKQNRSEKI